MQPHRLLPLTVARKEQDGPPAGTALWWESAGIGDSHDANVLFGTLFGETLVTHEQPMPARIHNMGFVGALGAPAREKARHFKERLEHMGREYSRAALLSLSPFSLWSLGRRWSAFVSNISFFPFTRRDWGGLGQLSLSVWFVIRMGSQQVVDLGRERATR